MVALLLASLVTYTLHAKDVFGPPPRSPQAQWSSPDNAFPHRKPIHFNAPDNTTLRGWLYPAAEPTSTYVLFFYGSNEDLAHEHRRLEWLSQDLHVNAVCFDYRGYGFSDGTINPSLMRDDALRQFDYLLQTAGPQARIVPYGWSVGSQFAIHVAKERKAAALILQAPPASADEMARWSSHHDVPTLARGFVHIKPDDSVRQIYQGAAEIQSVQAPLLIVHGENDADVPIEQGREVFAASPSLDKRLIAVPGAHHNDLAYTKPPAADAVANLLAPVQ